MEVVPKLPRPLHKITSNTDRIAQDSKELIMEIYQIGTEDIFFPNITTWFNKFVETDSQADALAYAQEITFHDQARVRLADVSTFSSEDLAA
jgi:hypothetical protein